MRAATSALMVAMLPAGQRLPGLAAVDLDAFWARLGQVAPVHLRLGLAAATVVLAFAYPLLTRGRPLTALDADAQDDVVQAAAHHAWLAPLVEVVRIVACLAYFADDRVQAALREPR